MMKNKPEYVSQCCVWTLHLKDVTQKHLFLHYSLKSSFQSKWVEF